MIYFLDLKDKKRIEEKNLLESIEENSVNGHVPKFYIFIRLLGILLLFIIVIIILIYYYRINIFSY